MRQPPTRSDRATGVGQVGHLLPGARGGGRGVGTGAGAGIAAQQEASGRRTQGKRAAGLAPGHGGDPAILPGGGDARPRPGERRRQREFRRRARGLLGQHAIAQMLDGSGLLRQAGVHGLAQGQEWRGDARLHLSASFGGNDSEHRDPPRSARRWQQRRLLFI
ncbi:MAG: hypothetical protein IVW57_18865 [Ktedonobacterales bacterium]|nr:hypothetical protein [Ktedonobacterales bacterium]